MNESYYQMSDEAVSKLKAKIIEQAEQIKAMENDKFWKGDGRILADKEVITQQAKQIRQMIDNGPCIGCRAHIERDELQAENQRLKAKIVKLSPEPSDGEMSVDF